MRVFVIGATGTIGRETVKALLSHGHQVVCLARPGSVQRSAFPDAAELRFGLVTDRRSLVDDGFRGEHFDVVVSCLASRSGLPSEAWAIDHRAHSVVLSAARDAGVTRMILLSAICVQRPLLAFQRAKLEFEDELRDSGLTYSIVRPTAFFKSLSGQIERVRSGKPFLVFGDGELTACKPISDRDLADFIAGCIADKSRWNRILPIGGPGPAITPRQQGEILFELLGQKPSFRRVPVAMLDAIIGTLATVGRLVPSLADKAELARIGRYYATESMLVLNPVTGRYDVDATPSHGNDLLQEHYRRVLAGKIDNERVATKVF